MSFHDDQPPIDEYDEYEDCVPVGLRWVMEKQDEILKLHSSEVQTNVFTHECDACKLFFKGCMFSKSQKKQNNGSMCCRWCSLGHIEKSQFDIHHHIHCNRGGKKTCGQSMTMTPPAPPAALPEKRIRDVAPEPEVTFTVKKKMSQKERKAADRAAKEALGP